MNLVDTKTIIDYHERCIEIMEGIQSFQRLIHMVRQNLDTPGAVYPTFVAKYENKIDTWERCIVRLLERYNNAMCLLQKESLRYHDIKT